MAEEKTMTGEDILKKYDKESNTMEYTGVMAKFVFFSISAVHGDIRRIGRTTTARSTFRIWISAVIFAIPDVKILAARQTSSARRNFSGIGRGCSGLYGYPLS